MAKKHSKGRKKSHYRNKKSNTAKPYLMSILVLILIALGIFYQKIHVITSYKSSDIATVTAGNDVKLYPYLFNIQTKIIRQKTNLAIEKYLLTYYKGEKMVFAKVRYRGKSYYIKAKQLQLTPTHAVNTYIASLNYPHQDISNQLNPKFAKISYQTANAKPKGVLIHATGNVDSSLDEEINYMAKHYATNGVFVHAFIDHQAIRQIADNRYMAQGAGPNANPYYIQFEMTQLSSADDFARQLSNAAYYTAYMLKKYNLPLTVAQPNKSGSLWTHALASHYLGGTDHADPDQYWLSAGQEFFGTPYSLENFRDLVQIFYNQI